MSAGTALAGAALLLGSAQDEPLAATGEVVVETEVVLTVDEAGETVEVLAQGTMTGELTVDDPGLEGVEITLTFHAADVFAEASLGDEGREGAMAFVQKRKPKWTE